MRPGETGEQWLERVEDTEWFKHTSREIPISNRAKTALQRAAAEADDLRHKAIRPDHLLLGILREEGTEAWRTLREWGVTLREVRLVLTKEGTEE